MIQNCCLDSIQKSDKKILKDLFSNVLLVGGTSLINGLDGRMYQELSKSTSEIVKIISPPSRKYFSWIGASLFVDQCEKWISKEEYNEIGPISSHKFN